MLRKTFYYTFYAGILFSLLLLVLLPNQVVVNYDANGLPKEISSKWVVIPCCLVFQGIGFLFCLTAPFFINYAYRGEVCKNMFGFFQPPSFVSETFQDFQDEEKMRKLRLTQPNLSWLAGIILMLFVMGMQWYIVVGNL